LEDGSDGVPSHWGVEQEEASVHLLIDHEVLGEVGVGEREFLRNGGSLARADDHGGKAFDGYGVRGVVLGESMRGGAA